MKEGEISEIITDLQVKRTKNRRTIDNKDRERERMPGGGGGGGGGLLNKRRGGEGGGDVRANN